LLDGNPPPRRGALGEDLAGFLLKLLQVREGINYCVY
jgi:hypothetical protein